MKSPKPPANPDAGVTAAVQGAQNRDTAVTQQMVNMVDQTTPYGSLTYNQTGTRQQQVPAQYDQNGNLIPGTGTTREIPRFEAVTSLSPTQQGLLEQEQEFDSLSNEIALDQTQRIGNLLSSPITTEGLPDRLDRSQIARPELQTSYVDDFSADRQRVEDALFERLNPQLERQRAQLETQLANKGLKIGSDAYAQGMDEFNRASNDARIATILGAGTEHDRLVDMSRNQAVFGNQSAQQGFANEMAVADATDGQRTQAFQENIALRNQPLNEVTALLNGQQISTPQFAATPAPPVAGVDYAGLVQNNYQNQLQNYGQQMAQYNQQLGGLYGLGSALAGGWARGRAFK